MTSLIIVLVILFISGLIAFVGDNVGRYAGRRHFSVFGLRPRRTAVLITVVVGVFIAGLTVLIMIIFSENVRVALFKLEGLRKELLSTTKAVEYKEKELGDLKIKYEEQEEAYDEQVRAYEALSQTLSTTKIQVQTLQRSKVSLQKSVQNLQIKIKRAKTEDLLFSVNQTIYADLIDGRGKNADTIRESINIMLSKVREFINKLYMSYGRGTYDGQINVSATNKKQIINSIKTSKSELIIKVIAAKNTIFGEEVEIRFKYIPNRLVFSKNALIISTVLNGAKSRKKIESDIRKLLIDVRNVALSKGMMTDVAGSVGVVEYAELYRLVTMIKKIGTKVRLDVKAGEDIYTSGPLKISFLVRG